jgi:integrase
MAKLQNHLLARGNKPQTVNQWLGCFKAILSHLIMSGTIAENVFIKTAMLKPNKKHQTIRGCYEIDKVQGVFNRRWPDKVSRLFCLMIYTTGLRNSEIERIRVRDIIKIRDCRFIHIRKSKTDNGIRLVPLHEYVYIHIARIINHDKKQEDDYIFTARGRPNQSVLYKKANTDMGAVLGFTPKQLAEQGITFYSGRHYWKTLMNACDLGDVEEYFMGHKVSGDVSKRYNHRDKQGQKKILEKAREVYRILDRRLFKG